MSIEGSHLKLAEDSKSADIRGDGGRDQGGDGQAAEVPVGANPTDLATQPVTSPSKHLFSICAIDADGRFLFLDDQAASNMGDTADKLVGRSLHEFFPQEEAGEYVSRVRRVMRENATLIYEDRIARQGYVVRWFSTVMHPWRDEQGSIIGAHVISHDISERKKSEAEIAERLRFEEIISNLASAFVSVNPNDVDGVACMALKAIGDFMAVDRSLLFWFSTDQEYYDCIHEWHAPNISGVSSRLQNQPVRQFPWICGQLLQGKSVVIPRVRELGACARAEQEKLLAQNVKSLVSAPMRVGGRTVGALCFNSVVAERDWSNELVARLTLVGDIIANTLERVRTARELAESRQFVQGITEATPYVVFLFDLMEQRVTYINRQVRHFLGYEPEEVRQLGGDTIAVLMHPDDGETYRHSLSAWRLAEDEEYLESEFRLRRKDGCWRHFRFCGRVFTRAIDGSVRQLIGIAEDVTERKQADDALQRHREQLTHVSRLSTMGEMVAGIAHEISQPLYSILNFAKASQNVLADRDDQPDEVREWLSRIVNSASQAGEIINRLRNFARYSDCSRSPESLLQTVGEAVELVQFEMRRWQIQVELPTDDFTVLVDKVQIKQVVVNLLQNAMEAMSDTAPPKRQIHIEFRAQENHVAVSVVDHGSGLPRDAKSIFDPFFTTKAAGLGMGLAISQTIIEEHGGEMIAESRPGGGSRLTFNLPVNERGNSE